MAQLDTYLKQMLENDGSDLHLSVGSVPKIRTSGRITPLSDEVITATRMAELLQSITRPERWGDYLQTHDLDLAYEIPGLARFRGSYFYNHWGQAAVFRQIPAEILLQHDALPNTIRTGKTSAVRGIIESSSAQGMRLMDSSIAAQLNAGNISPEEAYMKAANKDEFKKFLPTLEELSEEMPDQA